MRHVPFFFIPVLPFLLSMTAACDEEKPEDTGVVTADEDGDGLEGADDCDDWDPRIGGPTGWFPDTDGDGAGDADGMVMACDQPSGTSSNSADCDDQRADVNPSADEVCDGVDNDCDGRVDDDDPTLRDTPTWYQDNDGDGYGDGDETASACAPPSGFVDDASDCDDTDETVHPGADEVCDGVDNDCDGDTDEDAGDTLTWYQDNDDDDFGNPDVSTTACAAPAGYVAVTGDCDDDDASAYPGASEVCDGADNDCDGLTDDDDDSVSGQSTWYRDLDSDGWGDADYPVLACEQPANTSATAGECDDSDPTVHPGAVEVCDGIDNDCDGSADQDALDGSTWYKDDDGDRYGDPDESTTACDAPEGYLADDSDCDDSDADINPGASEICDGADNDCDGLTDDSDSDVSGQSTWYEDSDGDGFGNESVTRAACTQPTGYIGRPADCDDSDGAINPSATEICNGVDDDCDGVSLTCGIGGSFLVSTADAKLMGDSTATDAGHRVATADVNGDGLADILMSSPGDTRVGLNAGVVWVVYGPPSGSVSLSTAQGIFTGVATTEAAGAALSSAGDVNGDGRDDVLVGADESNLTATKGGAAFLLLGPASGSSDLSTSQAILTGEANYDYAACGVAGWGDGDGDGYADIAVGAQGNNDGGSDAGIVYLLNGPISGTVDLDDAPVKLTGEAAYDNAGTEMEGAGDVNGDGVPDLWVGVHQHNGSFSDAGAAYLLLGPISADMNLGSADAKLTGEGSYHYAGYAISGGFDANNDGYDDALIGAPRDSTAGAYTGSAYLVLGPISGTASLAIADARLMGANTYEQAGSDVAGQQDVDGDGNLDIVVGASNNSTTYSYSGMVYLVYGPATGSVSLSSADAIINGESTNGLLGWSVATGDLDGDGLGDMLLGAPGEDNGGMNSGAAYVFFGQTGF